MSLYKTPAIVLHSIPYREADVILTLYTPDHGKVRAVARGVRKPNSRLRGGVQQLTQGVFVLYAGRGLDTVTQSQLECAFPLLHGDIERWAQANYLAELVMTLVAEKEGNPEVYTLLLTALHLLEDEDPLLVSCFFQARFLSLLGYCPNLSSCGVCGRSLDTLAPQVGWEGFLCKECGVSAAGSRRISRRTQAALDYLLRIKAASLSKLHLDREALMELQMVLGLWLNRHLDRPLKSQTFLRGLKTESFLRG